MWTCKRCGGVRWNSVRDCGCELYSVTDEDGEDHEVWAMDAEGAALAFAEKSNVEGDYYLMDNSVTVEVDGVKFEISAEPDIHYSVNKVER